MYVIKTIHPSAGTDRMIAQELLTMSASEARGIPAEDWTAGPTRPMLDRTTYEHVPAREAREWVRRGKHHSTPLFLDGNTVRYAGRGI